MKELKKLTASILCIIMAITVIPMSAFAADEAYVEIKFANEEKTNITFGETEEVYIEYSAGEYENYNIVWERSSDHGLKIKYIKDEQTGDITRAKITGTDYGGYNITVKILDENGNEITSTKKLIRVVESENKSLKEKIYIFFRDTFFGVFFTMGFIILPLIAAPIIEPPYYIYLAIKYLVEEVF